MCGKHCESGDVLIRGNPAFGAQSRRHPRGSGHRRLHIGHVLQLQRSGSPSGGPRFQRKRPAYSQARVDQRPIEPRGAYELARLPRSRLAGTTGLHRDDVRLAVSEARSRARPYQFTRACVARASDPTSAVVRVHRAAKTVIHQAWARCIGPSARTSLKNLGTVYRRRSCHEGRVWNRRRGR